ncbi:MAG: rRNA pseudouridine synthase [Candidatus Omnitrophica bacterium]|nr:rRNA pseudouridine synthase [Candidatus Omnitrophota bacterium]
MKPSDKDPTKLRLQVFLSRNGVCSRRQAMDIIKEGHVKFNGQICREPSSSVDPSRDHVFVDGKRVQGKRYDYILLNKPAGYTTTKSDQYAQKTVLDLLPRKFRHLSPAGRLDRDTEGLLLLTNDGDTAYQLTHPKFNVDKTYFVRVSGNLEIEKRKKVERGVVIDGKRTAPAKIKNIKPLKNVTELMITIHEGRKRQVRFMFAKVGHKVLYLKRLMQGPLVLGALKKGTWRLLNRQEIERIKKI